MVVVVVEDLAGEAGLTVRPRWVANPGDGPDWGMLLTTASARAAGIVWVALSPTTRARRTDLARDVLRALGAQLPATLNPTRVAPQDFACFAVARLCGHRVRHVVIDRGQWLTPGLLDTARCWCAHVGAALSLLTPTTGAGSAEQQEQCERLRRLATTAPSVPSSVPAWPRRLVGATLPSTEFPFFRTDCHHLLPGLFDAIDAVFTTTFTQVTEHRLVQQAEQCRGDRRCMELITAVLAQQLTADLPPPPVRLIRLRATQAALWRHHNMLLSWQRRTLAAPPSP